jgi:hypothetical protein
MVVAGDRDQAAPSVNTQAFGISAAASAVGD